MMTGVAYLVRRDRNLHAIVERHGPPPLWPRRPGFATLVRIVLEQQVSLASAAATYRRLQGAAGRVTPRAVIRLGDLGIRAAGITRQKSRTLLNIAKAVRDRTLDLPNIGSQTIPEQRDALMQISGIGPWTADIYMLMALRHADVWPIGDLALDRMVTEFADSAESAVSIVQSWRPWRSVAARLLWHAYLCRCRT